jgi:GAF domain-containing protein
LAIPIKERGQIIGYLYAQKPRKSGKWLSEEIELAKTLSDQLEVALESARLYRDTQLLAEQERLVSDITSRMRQSLDIESVLKTAVKEIRSALDIPKVTIRLKPKIESTELE